jgi:AraC family transcriptional regulator
MERSEDVALDSSTASEPQFDCLANSLVQLLETAKQDLERDRNAVKASLAKASSILQSEIERRSGANGSGTGGLAGWQIARVRSFIDRNLHVTIHTSDLSAVARRSPAHFARSFKHSFGESPHAYVMRRRLEKACHLMMTSSESLSQIALSVGFSDQSHLCKRFKEALGQSPSNWRREREIFDSLSSHEPARTEGNGHGWPETKGFKVQSRRIVDRQPTREKLRGNRSSLRRVATSSRPGDGVSHERYRNIHWSSTISPKTFKQARTKIRRNDKSSPKIFW